MKPLSLLLLLFYAFPAFSQFEFLDTSLVWDLKTTGVVFFPPGEYCTADAGDLRLEIEQEYGDEVVYRIVANDSQCNQYNYFLWEMNDELYVYNDISLTYVYKIMSADSQVGDEVGFLNLGFGITYFEITEMDSILIDNSWQRRYILGNFDTIVQAYGPLQHPFFNALAADCNNSVEAVFQDGEVVYEHNGCMTTSIASNLADDFKIWYKDSKLRFIQIPETVLMQISSINGQVLNKLNIDANHTECTISLPLTSIYIATVFNTAGEIIYAQKFYAY